VEVGEPIIITVIIMEIMDMVQVRILVLIVMVFFVVSSISVFRFIVHIMLRN
jgi:hypothetical protein